MPTTKQRTQLILSPEALAALDLRAEPGIGGGAGRSQVINNALSRYFYAIATTKHEMQTAQLFTPEESGLVCDALNGTILEGWSIRHIPGEVSDGIALNGLDRKWNVDGNALVKKLDALTYLQLLALADAVGAFWRKPDADFADLLKLPV